MLEAGRGYDLVASYYEAWRWSRFWRLNEAPLVKHWLQNLRPGLGLDAGSGTGTYIPDVKKLGQRCVAVDLSRQMLNINRQKTYDCITPSPVLYTQGDIRILPFRDSQFNWVLCSRVLSHVPHLELVLREFARVLRSGSECLISDVHPDHPYTHVAIRIESGEVAIETYKHSLASLKRAVSRVQPLQLTSLDEYYFTDLHAKPPVADFEKLYRYSNPAIFYVCRLRRL